MAVYKRVLKNRVKMIFLIITYKVLLDLIYKYYVSKRFLYEGFTYNPNPLKIIESYIFIFTILAILPTYEKKPSTIALNVLNIVMILPIFSLYGLKNEPRIYFYGVLISFLITIFLVKVMPEISFTSRGSLNQLIYILLFAISIFVYIVLIYFNGVPSFQALNFNKVYDIRKKVNYGFNIMFYLVTWQGKIINPFLMIVFLKDKKKVPFFLVFVLQLLLYLITAHKSYLFYPMIIPFFIFYLKKEKFIHLSLTSMNVLIVVSMILFFTNVSKWIASLLAYRTLFLPAQISFQYYEYFSQNGFTLLSHSIFKNFFSFPVYNIDPVRIIGIVYYIGNYPNTGYLGDAYMNFGIIGMIVFSIIFGIILNIIDFLSNTYEKKLISGAFMPIHMISLTNTGLLTTLLTGGMLFYMLILWFYNDKTVTETNREL